MCVSIHHSSSLARLQAGGQTQTQTQAQTEQQNQNQLVWSVRNRNSERFVDFSSSLSEPLSRRAGHEPDASINTVPPFFTALPSLPPPPTRGHKPASNTRVRPEPPQTSARRKNKESWGSARETRRSVHTLLVSVFQLKTPWKLWDHPLSFSLYAPGLIWNLTF